MYDFNAGLMGFIAEYCSDMNAAAFIEMHVWPFNQINFISECLNSLRVILFWQSVILSGNMPTH